MSKNITFTPIIEIENEYYPKPSIKEIPDWYKKTNSFVGSNTFKVIDGFGNQTIKKCMPVFDSITAGYLIKTHVDVHVSITESNDSYFSWPSCNPISFHPIDQASLHPSAKERSFPKWMNPWSIKTSSGYSCLFIPPMHNPNGFFTIFPGIVDTDKYISPINFPFTLDDPNFEGIIPAGTTICQIIPFKRDSFSLKIGSKKDIEQITRFEFLFKNKWINVYKNKSWTKKNYK